VGRTKETMNRKEQEAKALTFEYLQKINFILKKIRLNDHGMFETASSNEDAEEKMVGKLIVQKVEFPDTGGVLTHFEGNPPMRGYPDGETVERVDEAKKMAMRMLWGFYKMPKIKFLLILPIANQIAENIIISYWEYIKKYRFKTVRYCQVVRELYRVFEIMGKDLNENEKEVWEMLRDDVCITAEGDDAYKFRFQIIIKELDKFNLKKNPIKELKRLIKLLSDREEHEGMKQKWEMLSKYLFLMRFKPKLLKVLVAFLVELDLDKLEMDENDLFHAKTKVKFNWGQ